MMKPLPQSSQQLAACHPSPTIPPACQVLTLRAVPLFPAASTVPELAPLICSGPEATQILFGTNPRPLTPIPSTAILARFRGSARSHESTEEKILERGQACCQLAMSSCKLSFWKQEFNRGSCGTSSIRREAVVAVCLLWGRDWLGFQLFPRFLE